MNGYQSEALTRASLRRFLPLFVSLPSVLFLATLSRAQSPALELVQTIELKGKPGKLDHLTVDSKSGRLFLANKVNNTVEVVDLKAGKPLRQLKAQAGAQGLAFAVDLDKLFVALGTGGYCNIFDGQNYKLLNTIKYADDADNVRYNPRTHLVYVAHAEKALGVIDGQTMEQKADINLPGSAESFQLESDRPRLYLNIPSPSQVAVIDTDKNEGGAELSAQVGNRKLPYGARPSQSPPLHRLPQEAESGGLGHRIGSGDCDARNPGGYRRRVVRRKAEAHLCLLRRRLHRGNQTSCA
jgi:hypothetical protein